MKKQENMSQPKRKLITTKHSSYHYNTPEIDSQDYHHCNLYKN